MKIAYGLPTDLDSWMALVQRVSWNFPGLETPELIAEHRSTVLRFMNDHRVVCAKDEETVIGVLLFSKKHNMICCLAVAPEYRRKGIASMLLSEALSQLDGSRNITVTTFRDMDEKGVAPRALYERLGFRPGKLLDENHYPVQEFVLSPKNIKE